MAKKKRSKAVAKHQEKRQFDWLKRAEDATSQTKECGLWAEMDMKGLVKLLCNDPMGGEQGWKKAKRRRMTWWER